MLKCVYGAAGSGKTEYVYNKIRENMEKGIKSFILVPEQSSMDTERTMIKKLGLSSQLMVEVLTFSRLSGLVFSECGPLRFKYIDRAGKLFVAQKTMQNLEKSLTYYRRNVHQRGFAQMTANLISELKRYGVEAKALSEAASKMEKTELSEKLNDIALIYEEYDRLISDKYSDAEENLVKAIPRIIKSGLFSGEFFICGFKSFTPVEHNALAEIMRGAEVTAVLCTDTLEKNDGIFASTVMTWEKLKNDAKTVGVSLGEAVYMDKEVKLKGNAELAHLKNNYFSYPTNIYKEETQNISLIFARESYDEVRACAQNIARLCRTENYRYGDFLILARNAESYCGAVKAVFDEYGISCFINEKKALSTNPFVRKVLAAVEILARGFSYERIMPVVKFRNENYTRTEGDVFENYILAASISHKHWKDKADWNFNPDDKRFSLETVNKVKRFTINSVIDLKDSIEGRKTVGEICGALLGWIEKEGLDRIMSGRVEELNQMKLSGVAMEYTRAWNAFSSVISQMEECMGDDFATYEKFYEMLRAACDEVKLNIAPPMSDQATFGEIDTFRKSDAKVVIVLGMVDGVFPKGYIEDGMLSDTERDYLSELGIELAPTAGFKRREEQNLIYNVLTAASEKLYLSVPLGDKEGKAVSRSEIIDRIKELFPNISEREDRDELADSPAVIFKSLLGALAKAKGDKEKLSRQDRMIYDWFAKDENLSAELTEFENSLKNYSPDAKLSVKAARELYGEKLMLSVSKLEKYNSCAFAYFMHYGLMAKERLRAGFEANHLGTVLHETLQKYFEELKETNADYAMITRRGCRDRVAEIAEISAREINEQLYETSPYYRYVALRLTSVAAATAWEIVKFYASSSFRPYGFEVKIGSDGEFAASEIDLGEIKAEITGFIDRIDTAEIDGRKYVNIIDYKSSAKNTDEELEGRGVQIQPLVYAGIACENLGANPSGMMYIHMNEPMLRFDMQPDAETVEKERQKKIEIKGVVLKDEDVLLSMDSRTETGNGYIPGGKKGVISREEMAERIEGAMDKVRETAGRIASGDIKIEPCITKDYNACTYCEYYGVCVKHRKTN